MASQTFNEFQRELVKRNIPENIAYVFTMIYEEMLEMSKQNDAAAKIMLEMAKTMENLTLLHHETGRKVFEFQKSQRDFGIEVKSVRNEPDE